VLARLHHTPQRLLGFPLHKNIYYRG
jgi:hypothetical protein